MVTTRPTSRLTNAGCCERVVVKALGKARDDQSLYLGTYKQSGVQGGRYTFQREGEDKLYIYFFTSEVSR